MTTPGRGRAVRRKSPRIRPSDWIEKEAFQTLLAQAAKDGVEPTDREVAASFPAGVVALSRWIERPNADLGGLTPVAAMQRGNTTVVLALIRAL